MNRLLAILAIAVTVFAPVAVNAQGTFPTRPVKIIVPYPAGGPADAMARIYADALSASFGQPFIVENRGGAAGAIGMQSVVKAPPDGYTLVLGTGSTVTVNQFLSKLPYDPINDLEPVSLIVMSPILLSANAAQPFRTIQELVQYARANPGRLNFGSDGQGSFTHLVGEMFKKAARIEMTHVPYKGTADSMNAVIAGDIQLVVGGVSGALLAQREIKRLNVLAVAGAQRIASLPDVPTLDESGLTGFEATSWYGILAPVGTDPAIRRRISQEIFRITARPDIIARIAASGQQPQASTPEAMRQRIKAESERWSALIRELNIKVD